MATATFRRPGISRCDLCPLRGQKPVHSTCGTDEPAIAIFGESPGAVEVATGKPFVGPAGSFLDRALAKGMIQRRNVWIGNVICCQPPNNDLSSPDGRLAVECCRPGFEAELKIVMRTARVVMPLGNHAMDALGLPNAGITRARGSVYLLPKVGKRQPVAVPTFHPSYIQRGNFKEIPTWVQDFVKARELATGPAYKPPKERFNVRPSLGDLEAFRDRTRNTLVGVDIETTGLRPGASQIVVVGLAESAESAISVPFLSNGGALYWRGTEPAALELLGSVLKTSPTIFQNAAFDIPHLAHAGLVVGNLRHDTLVLHHDIHPELPHRLDYIVSIYGRTPYWKGEVLKRTTSILTVPDEELRTYNLRDAVVLLQILPELLTDLRLNETEETYQRSMQLLPITMAMTENGLPLSKGRLVYWRNSLRKKLDTIDKEMKHEYRLPEGFNLQSSDHLDLLFGQGEAYQFQRAKDEAAKYDEPGSKRKRNTKKYAEVQSLLNVARNVKPLLLPRGYRPVRTDGGRMSYKEEHLLNLKIATNNRLALLASVVRPTPDHLKERAALPRLVSFIDQIGKRSEVEKLLSTYTDFPVWSDGRVHPKYKVWGTATGRLSSGGEKEYTSRDDKVNAQNVPEEARRIFVAPKGTVILTADYSNLELRVLAYVSGDPVLIDIFAQGKNVHDENTRLLFGIDKDHPKWDVARRASKVYIFGRGYGGGLQGIYRRVWTAVPDLGLTFNQFRDVDEKYRLGHPVQEMWRNGVEHEVVNARQLRNVFGRLRIFLGTDDEIVREGLNFPIQSAAADIINISLIEMWPEVQSVGKLIAQVHDSLVFEVQEARVDELARIVQTHMEREFTIGKNTVRFPVDFKLGPSWGEQHEWKKTKTKAA